MIHWSSLLVKVHFIEIIDHWCLLWSERLEASRWSLNLWRSLLINQFHKVVTNHIILCGLLGFLIFDHFSFKTGYGHLFLSNSLLEAVIQVFLQLAEGTDPLLVLALEPI